MRIFLILTATFLALLVAVLRGSFSDAASDADVAAPFGEPIPGLTSFQRTLFDLGKKVFERRFTRSDGLGPHFNAVSCKSCHEDPAIGGSAQRYRDFFLAANETPEGTTVKPYIDCTAENAGEQRTTLCLPSIVVPHYGPYGDNNDPVAPNVEHAPIPEGTDIVARRNTPPLFGVGLFRLVSDEEILSRADPNDADGDGISGRANIIPTEDNAIGRFGFKCQTASIEAFNRGALINQMGITSDSIELIGKDVEEEEPSLLDELFGIQSAYAQVAEPVDRIVDQDGVFDPEMRRSDLINLVFFQEHLGAPQLGAITRSVIRGEAVFERIGCTGCHTPSLTIDSGLIYPYTDLLLHDMGPENADGIVMHGASGSEYRTHPLWGLCQHRPFLHDGSADTVEEAITKHGGEAEASRNEYLGLSATDKRDLHRFLESL